MAGGEGRNQAFVREKSLERRPQDNGEEVWLQGYVSLPVPKCLVCRLAIPAISFQRLPAYHLAPSNDADFKPSPIR